MKRSKLDNFTSDKVFDIVNYVIMAILGVLFVWPLWFVLIASVSSPDAVWAGEVVLFPVDFSFTSYLRIFQYDQIWVGYRNTIFYTVVGTTINLILTVLIAYPLSKKNFLFKNFFMKAFMVTMYFSGGLIPSYMLVQNLGMVDTPFALIIPNAVSFFNVIITRTFFQNSIPDSLEEAASIDGASLWTFFCKIALPLSKPILAVIVLYYAVTHWNSYFSALIYITDRALQPLQLVLRSVLINNSITDMMESQLDEIERIEQMRIAESMKYGIIVVSALPLLCFYPFIQKYFVKGVMIGAIKG